MLPIGRIIQHIMGEHQNLSLTWDAETRNLMVIDARQELGFCVTGVFIRDHHRLRDVYAAIEEGSGGLFGKRPVIGIKEAEALENIACHAQAMLVPTL